jgi:hypothetical protein
MPQPTWQVVTIVEILRGDITSGATDEVTRGATDEVIGETVAIIPKSV